MKTYASGFEDHSIKRKKISRKSGKRNDAHVKEMVSRYTDDEISEMNESNHSRVISRSIDRTGRGIFRSIQSHFFIQAKLEISQPGDTSEVQADKMASAVTDGDTERSQEVLSKQAPMISPQSEGGGLQTSSEFDTQLQHSKGSGQKLDSATQSELESHTGTDLSQVNVHTDTQASQMSESINAKAFTHGSDIYFKSGQYNPQSDSGKELLAHEVAHTVQQSEGMVQPKIQRFEAWEHSMMGNVAYGSAEANIQLGPNLKVTFGQLTALGGDYFESIEDLMKMANTKGSDPSDMYFDKPGTQDEIRYIIEYHIDGRDQNEAIKTFYSQEVRDAADNRSIKLLATNWDHFSDNLSAKDHTSSFVGKLNAPDIEGKLPNNELAYRKLHEKAIATAYYSGFTDGSLDAAMIYEGFASHFLTDAFAAGHVRTQTRVVQQHWNSIYPMFSENIKGWLLEHLAEGAPDKMGIKSNRTWYNLLESQTKELLSLMAFTFGDLIGGVLHDYDNAKGLKVKTGNEEIDIYGDKEIVSAETGKLAEQGTHERKTFEVATGALHGSIDEIRMAFALGQAKTSFNDMESLYNVIRANEPLYSAEQKWPAALEEQTPERKQLNWKVSSLNELFSDPRMAKGITDYSNYRVLPAVEATKKGLTGAKGEIAGSGLAMIADKLKGDAPYVQDTLAEIINYYPGSITHLAGKKGRKASDNANEYFEKAHEKGATGTLTPEQRAGLINSCLQDPDHIDEVGGNSVRNDQLILRILLSAPTKDIFTTIQLLDEEYGTASGWRKIVEFLNEEHLDAFIEYIGPRYWKAAPKEEKLKEWSRLSEKQKIKKNVREMRIMMIILQNSEQSLNNDVKVDKGMESPIFNIPYDDFIATVNKTIKDEGEEIFQTHFTNFCGKVSLVRLWIKIAPNDYRRFMLDLYYTGESTINDTVFKVPQQVIDAANENSFKPDPEQKSMYQHKGEQPGVKLTDLITIMDMVFYLTLASKIANFPVSWGGEYDPDKCKENKPWAGAALAPETQLMEKLGFSFDDVGNSFRRITRKKYDKLLAAVGENLPVFLLVNSYMLDLISSNKDKIVHPPEEKKHVGIGTHWIAVTHKTSKEIHFWEYAEEHSVSLDQEYKVKFQYEKKKGIEEEDHAYQFKDTIAGGIIVKGYRGKKITLYSGGKKARLE